MNLWGSFIAIIMIIIFGLYTRFQLIFTHSNSNSTHHTHNDSNESAIFALLLLLADCVKLFGAMNEKRAFNAN